MRLIHAFVSSLSCGYVTLRLLDRAPDKRNAAGADLLSTDWRFLMVASARGEGPVLRYPPFSLSRSTSFGQEHAQGKTLRVPRKKPRTGQTPSVILCVLCCALESQRHRNQLTCDQLKACMLMAHNRLESLSAQ